MSSISVSNITIGTSCAYYKTDALTEKTKKKLIELSIPITRGMTETEALQKIAQAEASAKNAQDPTGTNRDNNTMTLLLLKLKKLARDTGTTVSYSDTARKILNNIKKRLKYLSSITKPEDKEMLRAIQGFKARRYELKIELDRVERTQERILSAMDMISLNNKIHFGLANQTRLVP